MATLRFPLATLGVLLLLALPAHAEPALTSLASPSSLTLADVSWRSDGRLALAVGGEPGQGVVLAVRDDEARVAWEGTHRLLAVAWHPREPVALATGDDALLRTEGTTFTSLALPDGVAPFHGRSISWKPDGTEALVSGSALLRYTTATGAMTVLRQSEDESFGAVAWSPRGDVALVEQALRTDDAWRTGRVLTWDGQQLAHVADAGSGTALVTRIAWEPGGAFALLTTQEPSTGKGPVLRWEQGRLQPAFTPPAGFATGVAWQGKDALLVGAMGLGVANTDGAVFEGGSAAPQDLLAAAWQPGGATALLAGAGGALHLWGPTGTHVRLEAPLPGAVVRTQIPVVASAGARVGHTLQGVEWKVDDGAWLPLTLSGATWRATWDPAVAEGMHTLRVRARDDAGVGPDARADVRVVHHDVPPALRGDVQGDLARLTWTDTGGTMYEVQEAHDASFQDAHVLARTTTLGAAVTLGPGEHHLRVRTLQAAEDGAWSTPVVLRVDGAEERAATPPGAGPADAKVPGPAMPVVALAVALALFLLRRRA